MEPRRDTSHEQHQHHRPGEHGQRPRPSRAVAGGNTVEIIGRDPVQGQRTGRRDRGATVGGVRRRPGRGHRHRRRAVRQCGCGRQPVRGRPGGKVIVDITNPFSPRPRAGHPRGHVRRAGDRQGGAARRARRQGIQHASSVFVSGRRAARWTCSSPATTRRPRQACRRSSRAWDLRPLDAGGCPWRTGWKPRACLAAGPRPATP